MAARHVHARHRQIVDTTTASLQRSEQLFHARKTVLRILLEALVNDARHLFGDGQIRVVLLHRRRRIVHVRHERSDSRPLVERDFAREHFVEHHAERVDVGARRNFGADDLFRGHVFRRPHEQTLLRQLLRFTRHIFDETEVEHLDVVRFISVLSQQHVARLEIAMHDADPMRFT